MKNNNFDIVIGNISILEFDIFGGIDSFYINECNSFIIDKETKKINNSASYVTTNSGELFMAMKPLYIISLLSCIKYMNHKFKETTPISEIISFRKSTNNTNSIDLFSDCDDSYVNDCFLVVESHSMDSILNIIDSIEKPIEEYDFNNSGFRYINITTKHKVEYFYGGSNSFDHCDDYHERITFLNMIDI